MENQKHLFSLSPSVTYLNNSYMSPSLKSVEKAGIAAVIQKNNPHVLKPDDFFSSGVIVKKLFSDLIDCDDYERIAIIPSVSYGIANVTKNIKLNKGDEIILIQDQFPSNVNSWKRLADESGAHITFINKPNSNTPGKDWNALILNAISDKTAVISMAPIHWTDGTLFDLKKIKETCEIVKSLLILDGTQAIGALPFSISAIQPDALICGAYKWLMGPYAIGLAYYGPYFDNGIPIEESWTNRSASHDFSKLTQYQEAYKPKAHRYSVGESANFILIPMLIKALEQLLSWDVEKIQRYTKELFTPFIGRFKALGCTLEEEQFRCNHLIGIKLPKTMHKDRLQKVLEKRQIFVSQRAEYMRIAMHVYNTSDDLEALIECLESEAS